MSPRLGRGGRAKLAHTGGRVMPRFLRQDREAPPPVSSKAWGEEAAGKFAMPLPFPRAAGWRRGDGGGREKLLEINTKGKNW